jgi:2-polyprenyl-3-methyl-5-hydroxy-6-metoxy-1,4-benzoquinol methylase
MSEQENCEALSSYFDLMSMNGGAQVYHVSLRLGIIDATGKQSCGAHDVARACGLRDAPVQLLLEALCGLRVLKHDGETYQHTPLMHFLAGQYRHLGNEYWKYLPEFLKSSEPLAAMDDPEYSETYYRSQAAALAWMMQPAAEKAASLLLAGTGRRGLNIIDAGAGAAVWSTSIAAQDKRANVTAVDWPAVLEMAVARARERGLDDRFKTLPGNYHDIEFSDETYDLAIAGNVTHLETEAGNRSLFRKLHASLRTGGEIAVFDVMPGQEDGDLARALYALGLAMRTRNGRVYPREELEGLLTSAGFSAPSYSPLEVAPYTMGMILARKGESLC